MLRALVWRLPASRKGKIEILRRAVWPDVRPDGYIIKIRMRC
jgi:hypothetical protein